MRQRRIFCLQYTNPAGYPPLEHLSALLTERGWEVDFLGTEPVGTEKMRFPKRPRLRVRLLRWTGPGIRQKIHYLVFCLQAVAAALFQRPRWIYASDPFSCPAALILSLPSTSRVIYHEHDSPSAAARSFWMRWVLRARRKLAGRAVLCLLPNLQRAKRFSEEMGRPDGILCLWNCPSREEASVSRGQEWRTPLRLVFHGSWGPGRLPVSILEAMAALKGQVRLTVIGYETVGHIGYSELFRRRAEQLGVAAHLDWKGVMPIREEMLACIRQADLGLCWMPVSGRDFNEEWMVGASNKPFEYLACGVALLVSDLPEWKELYVEGGYGLACDPSDPKSIAETLRWFLEHPGPMRRMGEAGRRRVLSEWNYEAQFAPVLRLLEEHG